MSHPPPDRSTGKATGSPPGWGCLLEVGENNHTAGPWWRLHTPARNGKHKVRRMLPDAGHFPETPSLRSCESWALLAPEWELASHTHTHIHLPPEKAWEPGGTHSALANTLQGAWEL